MSLKLIPVEKADFKIGKKTKNFNPGNKIGKKAGHNNSSLKSICLRLVHYINRGGAFTYSQIDELIIGLHHSILGLQKKKQELLKKKNTKYQRKK